MRPSQSSPLSFLNNSDPESVHGAEYVPSCTLDLTAPTPQHYVDWPVARVVVRSLLYVYSYSPRWLRLENVEFELPN